MADDAPDEKAQKRDYFKIGVIVLLTLVNSFAPYAAAGGHRYGIFKFACLMMIISGVSMLVVPWMVSGLFASVSTPPTAVPTH